MRQVFFSLFLVLCLSRAVAFADTDSSEPDAGQPDAGPSLLEADAGPPPLHVREPPFVSGDYSWMNGNNYQSQPIFVSGPFTWTLLLDVHDDYDFNRPEDHTIFPATTGPRHNEFNLNYAVLGVEATGVTDVIGHDRNYKEGNCLCCQVDVADPSEILDSRSQIAA